jgi:hypothetical protein
MGRKRSAHKVFVKIPKGKRKFVRLVHRWEGNIKINLEERGWKGVDLIYLRVSLNRDHGGLLCTSQ